MGDNVDVLDGVDLDGDVDMESHGDVEEEEDEEEEDEEKEDKEEEEEDKDENDAKEPRTIGLGEMANTSADDEDIIVDDQQIVLPEQGQEMREYTPRVQLPAPAPRPRNSQIHPLSGLENSARVMPQEPRPAVPTLQEAEAAGITSDVNVDQQLLIESAGGDSLPDVRLPDAWRDGSLVKE